MNSYRVRCETADGYETGATDRRKWYLASSLSSGCLIGVLGPQRSPLLGDWLVARSVTVHIEDPRNFVDESSKTEWRY